MLLLLRPFDWMEIITIWGSLGGIRGAKTIYDLIREMNLELEDEEIAAIVSLL